MFLFTNCPENQKLSVTPVALMITHNYPRKLLCLILVILHGIINAEQIARADTLQHHCAGDVPIMNGLEIEPELGFAFDSPSGRIVMIFASTTAPSSKIMAFYGSSLIQLGWRGGNGNWVRKGEKLEIGVVETVRGPLWRIMLQPN